MWTVVVECGTRFGEAPRYGLVRGGGGGWWVVYVGAVFAYSVCLGCV